jgi:four helix bundle protein
LAFRFKKFKVYQEAKNYCQFFRKITREQVTDRNLADQIVRALNSIVLNIAEGSADHSDIEFARFLGISIRSVYETVAGCDLAHTYGMIDGKLNEEIEKRAETLVKQLSAFRSSLLDDKGSHKL